MHRPAVLAGLALLVQDFYWQHSFLPRDYLCRCTFLRVLLHSHRYPFGSYYYTGSTWGMNVYYRCPLHGFALVSLPSLCRLLHALAFILPATSAGKPDFGIGLIKMIFLSPQNWAASDAAYNTFLRHRHHQRFGLAPGRKMVSGRPRHLYKYLNRWVGRYNAARGNLVYIVKKSEQSIK